MAAFPKGSRKPKIVGKATSSRKLGGGIDTGSRFWGERRSPSPTLSYVADSVQHHEVFQ